MYLYRICDAISTCMSIMKKGPILYSFSRNNEANQRRSSKRQITKTGSPLLQSVSTTGVFS